MEIVALQYVSLYDIVNQPQASAISLPPSLYPSHQPERPVLCSNCPLAVCLTQYCICVSAALSSSTLSVPICVHKSDLYILASVP